MKHLFYLLIFSFQISYSQILECGAIHGISLCSENQVMTWGGNAVGMLGVGQNPFISDSALVVSFTGAVAVAAGHGHSLALKKDSTLWAWGHNDVGQLGINNLFNYYVPVKVTGLTGVTGMDGGSHHSIAIKDSSVWVWGSDDNNQLGDATSASSSVPVKIKSLSGIVAVSAGVWHSLALRNDGTVWAFGSNLDGQLGNSSTVTVVGAAATQVTGLTGVKGIAAGGMHSLALKNDGTVWTWGLNLYGQLGTGNKISSSIPIKVPGLNNVVAIAGGGRSSLALKNDGSVWAWGGNNSGQLGIGTYSDSFNPVQLTTLIDITHIAAGTEKCAAIESNGTIWNWGSQYTCCGNAGPGYTSNPWPLVVQATSCRKTTGAEEILNDMGVSVYPVPASGIITLQILNQTQNFTVMVRNITGLCIKRIDSINCGETKIDLSAETAGIYFLEISSRNQRTIKKIIIQ